MEGGSISPSGESKRSEDFSESESSNQTSPSPNKKMKMNCEEPCLRVDIKEEFYESDDIDSNSNNGRSNDDIKDVDSSSDNGMSNDGTNNIYFNSNNGFSNDDINDFDSNSNNEISNDDMDENGDLNDSIQDSSSEETLDEASFNHKILSRILNKKKMVNKSNVIHELLKSPEIISFLINK